MATPVGIGMTEEGSAMSPSIFLNSLSLDVENDPDLMSFELIDSIGGRGRDMAAAAWQMLPQQLTEIRGMAETVGSVVSENIHVSWLIITYPIVYLVLSKMHLFDWYKTMWQ